MDFEPRLSILRQAGMLSDEDYQQKGRRNCGYAGDTNVKK